VTNKELTSRMRKLSIRYPAMHLDATTTSEIESGTDEAEDFSPIVREPAVDFEREALLMFYTGLNVQRHLVGIMLDGKTEPAPKRFLESIKAALDECHERIGSSLSRRYFSH
jgi:hypothetical protein